MVWVSNNTAEASLETAAAVTAVGNSHLSSISRVDFRSRAWSIFIMETFSWRHVRGSWEGTGIEVKGKETFKNAYPFALQRYLYA